MNNALALAIVKNWHIKLSTVCNMSIECGARAGLVAPDQQTYNFIKGRKFAPQGEEFEAALQHWQSFISDPSCSYDKEITIDVSKLDPMVTWGTNPGQATMLTGKVPSLDSLSGSERESAVQALSYIGLNTGQELQGVPIDWAFVGSCTNGRIEDLRVTAAVLRNKKVAKSVNFYIVPGSEDVRRQAIEEGLDKVFKAAGADFRMPGCSMCLAMNDDVVPAGKRCVSSSNRNFVGRQGSGSKTHLASPATVAASAVAGVLTPSPEFLGEK
jgi:3-isopropylmalate/(R)-2-methylmalate dehydratase large subunit